MHRTDQTKSGFTDITYVATTEGWLYVAAILDGWSRRVLGWSCSVTLHTPLVLAALARRQPRPGLIHHSDRGCQYVETFYIRARRHSSQACIFAS